MGKSTNKDNNGTLKNSHRHDSGHGHPCMNRRDLLKTAGLAITGAALVRSTGCDTPEEPLNITIPEAPQGAAAVGITRNENIEEAVRTVIEMAGGLSEIAQGDTVLIKPNISVSTIPGGRCTTSLDVLRAVIRAVKERTGTANITVGEASAMSYDTQTVARQLGFTALCGGEGVAFLAFDEAPQVMVTSPSFTHFDFPLSVPKALTDGSYDHFINVPVLKNHDFIPGANTDYTCCIKNHVGIVHPDTRSKGGEASSLEYLYHLMMLNMGIHNDNLGEVCAEISLVVPRHVMNVVDALDVVLSGGPASYSMVSAHPGLVLASKDRVACDSLAVAVLRHYALTHTTISGTPKPVDRPYVNKSVWAQAQITRARELNLGRGPASISIEHENVDTMSEILALWA